MIDNIRNPSTGRTGCTTVKILLKGGEEILAEGGQDRQQ